VVSKTLEHRSPERGRLCSFPARLSKALGLSGEINMLIRMPVLLFAFLLAGCASSSKTFDAEGKEAYSLNCSGTARNWGMCYEKAGEICGAKGYEIVQKSGDSVWIATGSTSGFAAGSTIARSMTIRCKE
jgi:hypothetical protein